MISGRALIATHIGAVALGYAVAPRDLLDQEVKRTGFFQTDTSKVLSATVDSLRMENKLLVFSYKGDAKVIVERSVFWIFGGSQELIVPGVVNYYLDLSRLGLEDVSFNEKAKLVTVKLPRLVLGDIAFQPELARSVNGGVLTYSQAQVDELSKLNYAAARKALTKQAQGPAFIQVAQRRAKENVTSYFEIPLPHIYPKVTLDSPHLTRIT